MLTKILKKINFGLGLLGLVFFFPIIMLHTNKNITDDDTFFHIRTGQYILQHGFPKTDVFSCSVMGKTWIDHEWLWQVLLALFHKLSGGDGAIAIQAFVSISLYLILFFIGYRKERIFLVTALLFLGMFLSPDRSLIRPDMVSLLFSLVEVLILWLFLKKSWSIYLLFFVQVLWTNIHGFFILGPILGLLICLAEYIKRHVPLPCEWNSTGRLTDQEFRNLIKIGVALILACFVNPHFINGFLYPIKVILDIPGDARYFHSTIGELHRSVSIRQLFNLNHRTAYKLLIVLSSISFVINYRKIDIRVLALWIFFLFFSWAAVRNLIFFMPAAYLALIVNLSQIRFNGILKRMKYQDNIKNALLICLQIGFIAAMGSHAQKMLNAFYFDAGILKIRSSYGQLTAGKFPRRASDFLIQNKIMGNFFNDLGVGHHLIATNYPRIKVFIDGRTEVYGSEFFKTYHKILKEGDWDVFEEQVKKFNITGVFLSSLNKPIPAKFLSQIYSHPDWKLVYFDYDAVIFLKDVPQNKEAISLFPLDLSQWKTESADALLLRHVESVTLYRNRANTLHDLGFNEQAANELAEAIRIQPAQLGTIMLKAHIEHGRGRDEQALSLYKQALQLSPRSLTVMRQLAFVYESMNDYPEAMNVGQKMIQQAPRDPRGYFVLSRVLAQTSRYEESFSALIKARDFHLDKNDILTVVDILYHQKASSWVRKACGLVYPDGKDMNETCHLIGMDG